MWHVSPKTRAGATILVAMASVTPSAALFGSSLRTAKRPSKSPAAMSNLEGARAGLHRAALPSPFRSMQRQAGARRRNRKSVRTRRVQALRSCHAGFSGDGVYRKAVRGRARHDYFAARLSPGLIFWPGVSEKENGAAPSA